MTFEEYRSLEEPERMQARLLMLATVTAFQNDAELDKLDSGTARPAQDTVSRSSVDSGFRRSKSNYSMPPKAKSPPTAKSISSRSGVSERTVRKVLRALDEDEPQKRA